MNKSITVIVFTFNEEKNISDCIRSAKFLTSKIIVIDMESSDKTAKLTKLEGVVIYNFPRFSYVEPAREFGIGKATSDWILILDADERITLELANEIAKRSVSTEFTHYKIPRKNIFGKIWLKHGGWWPDYQIRLINKSYFKKWPKEIHSTPHIEGQLGMLANPLLHYFHANFEKMVAKTMIFEDRESDLLFKAGKTVSTLTFFRKFLGELYRRLLKNIGFLDGEIGIIESTYQAFSKTITYLFLYEKRILSSNQNKKSSPLRPLS